jgi:hypothetical protein
MTTQKTSKEYFYMRYYAICVLIAWNAIGLFFLYTDFVPENVELVIFIALAPFALPLIVILIMLLAHPFDYSLIGGRKPRPIPHEQPIVGVQELAARVGWWPQFTPGIGLKVFRTGLGVTMTFGDAFIAVSEMITLRRSVFGWYSLRHTSPEVRSPVVFHSHEVFTALNEILANNRRESAKGNGGRRTGQTGKEPAKAPLEKRR